MMFDFVEAHAAEEFRRDLLVSLYAVRTGRIRQLLYVSPEGRTFRAELEGGRVAVRDHHSETIECKE